MDLLKPGTNCCRLYCPTTDGDHGGGGSVNVCKLLGLIVLSMCIGSFTYYITVLSDASTINSLMFQHASFGPNDASNVLINHSNRSNNTVNTTGIISRSTTAGLAPERFVTFAGGFKDGRGLGNQMFNLAVVVYVAEMTGREPVMERVEFVQAIDAVFNLTGIKRFADVCPCYHFGEDHALTYDERIEQFGKVPHVSANTRTVTLGGFFQSWKYTRITSRSILSYFQFREEISQFAQTYIKSVHPPGWMRQGYTRVAIHVRRGDLLTDHAKNFGYTVPDADYFRRAMNYFIAHYRRVQFIAISQDKDWTTKNVVYNWPNNGTYSVNVTYAFDHTHGQDMAVMAGCDHVIMSTGTYGWWGAWLAKGTTIYYRDWPRNQSALYKMFIREDFYPPAWIPM